MRSCVGVDSPSASSSEHHTPVAGLAVTQSNTTLDPTGQLTAHEIQLRPVLVLSRAIPVAVASEAVNPFFPAWAAVSEKMLVAAGAGLVQIWLPA